jgi:hypothetical protein
MPRSDHLLAMDRDREQVISLVREFVLGGDHTIAGSNTD